MPKLRKEDVADLDIEMLDEVEYSTETYADYSGEVPPADIQLTGYTKRMWWARTNPKANGGGNDPMLKVLWIADGNEGDYEEYNGCPFWESLALVPGAKFRWAPFLDCYGLTLKQIKTQTYVSDTEDQYGAPIERIGNWHPGEDHDEAWCDIVTARERYAEQWQPRVGSWIALEEATEDEAEPEEEDEELEDELEDEEPEEDEDEEEDEPEPEPAPARSRRSARAPKTAATPPARSGGRTPRGRAAKPAPARTARSGRTSKPARSSRSRAAQDEPPF
jgi:hypothetical protein